MMKKNLLLTVAVAVLALGSSAAQAAEESATGNIKAKIVSPVSITQQGEGLDFGTMIAPADAATVTIASSGSRSSSKPEILVGTNEGAAGIFEITGADSQSVTVTLPDSATLNGSESGEMTVNTFTSSKGTAFTLDGGTATMNVGATLNVGASQPEGDYTGTYEIKVSY